jgi:hypothetical protein
MLTFFQVNCDAADCVASGLNSGFDAGLDAGFNVDHFVCVDNSVDDDSVYDSVNNDSVYDLVNDA